MKKLLVNFLITLRNFLTKTASRLDSRFRYFHIELLPNQDTFTASYDNKHTLDAIYSFVLNSGFKSQLEYLGAESLIVPMAPPEQIVEAEPSRKKLSTDKTVIAWEHYKSNYLDKSLEEDDDLFNDDFNDDDDEGGIDIEDMMPPGLVKFGMMQNNKPMHVTPWGKFEYDNPISPVHLYELQMVKFRGFSTKSIPNFPKLMSSIEGIAIWGQIDPYCIIVGPSKMYDFQEVRYNLEYAIYNALNLELPATEDTTSKIEKIREKSLDLYQEDGIKNITIVFPDNDNTTEVINDFSNDDITRVDNLISRVNGVIVFINGELYYAGG